ncbi:hypothetical protein LZC95_46960 [Pendulispora brunnea]|uniref:Uncharacterized protein n=1 Tax=Pendulispora brunnea TaxID=2905690 RepID=A0ABZ2KNX9_9BACT
MMRLHCLPLLVILTACSSHIDAATNEPRPDDPNPSQHAISASSSVTLIPSNLPPDTCTTAGAGDLIVPRGTSVSLDPNAACDAVVSQGPNLPAICVRKFANVAIAGTLAIDTRTSSHDAVAIVATNAFQVSGRIDGRGRGDVRGTGGNAPEPGRAWSGAGAGHATPGAPGLDGDPPAAGGGAYATSRTDVATGAAGGVGGVGLQTGAAGGRAGGALHIVACHDLDLSGTLSVAGGNGERGGDGWAGNPVPALGGGGGGGGSGGTLLVEALHVLGSGAALSAIGGTGGTGGTAFLPTTTWPGGAGGAGGTGSHGPTVGENSNYVSEGPYQGITGSGGGGGASGRIAILVPTGTALPAVTSDPPATVGAATVQTASR